MNMTPMIDVVFQLLIFFMTCTQVSRINNEKLELPEQQGSQEQIEGSVIVNVRRDGQAVVSGREVSVPEVVGVVADELARVGNRPENLTVVVRADAQGTCRAVNEIVTSLAQLQITRIRIAVQVPRS